jgi:hypothetical protein
MHAASDLAKLHDAVQYRLKRIKNHFASISGRPETDRNLVITTCVVELDNTAICTLREFTVSSLRRARTVRGHRISVNRRFGPETEIAAYVLSVVNIVKYNRQRPTSLKRDEEQTIRDPKDTEKILISCAATNLPSLQKALALNVGIFRDIPTVRNFYAHRNENTWRKVRDKARAMGVGPVRHPDDFVQSSISGRPVSVFEDWLAEAELFFDELMQ